MASCLGCGKEMLEASRKIIKGEVSSGCPNYKVVFQCQNSSCSKKELKIPFIDDGMMMIPLPDGQ
jgi:hypothetical protein